MAASEVQLRRKALADVSLIQSWYRQIDTSLALRFLDSLNASLDRIQAFPFSYQVLYRNTRRAQLERFPSGVFYLVKDDVCVVLAVMHHQRNPELAQGISE